MGTLLHVLSNLQTGGTELNTLRLAQGLNRRGWSQQLILLTDQIDPALRALAPCPIVQPHRRLCRWRSAAWLAEQLRKHPGAVVHSRALVTWLDSALAVLMAGGRSRWVQSFHGPATFQPYGWLRRGMIKYLSRFTPHYLTVSHDLANRLQSSWRVTPSAITVIPNGIDLTRYRPADDLAAAKQQIGYQPDDLVIGSVGSLYEVKNQRLLIEALEGLVPALPQVRILLVGDGPMRTAWEQLAEARGWRDHVCFTGVQQDVVPWLQAMDIYVQTSRLEGSPTAVLEAMAVGRPVVATASPGCMELNQAHGWPLLVPIDDPAQLAQTLRALAADRSRCQQSGAAGLKLVRDHYSLEQMVDAYDAYYRQLLIAQPVVDQLLPSTDG
ncbi:MAG: D-inositol-3-phosphate glycosyltransferase [Phycisphaerae bacterium]|nr:D-inositol-3-phosphate glycosyltransferase [Phycisphaerae bacterium]